MLEKDQTILSVTIKIPPDFTMTLKTVGVLLVLKFTDTGKALKEWCLLMDETYGEEQKEGYVDNSFANETKMVT